MTIPQAFIDEIASYHADTLSGLAEALSSTEPEVSIRINRAKGILPPQRLTKVNWCETGFYLPDRPQFTFDPNLHQGLYYVQDASSMAISHVLKRLVSDTPLTYLDACAAPGGKTTAAIASLPEGSLVVANEYDYRRAAVLAENIAKWGSPDVIVSRGDTSRFSHLKDCFDIIAADVPCSGEGMMRKDDDAVAQWSHALVAECVSRQREIVGNLWDALRPGGYMIYSTCTFNRHEDEEMVDYICEELGGETVDVGLDTYEGVAVAIDSDRHCYRFIPGRIRGEGLFISVIRKSGERPAQIPKAAKKPVTVISKAPAESAIALQWLKGEFELRAIGERIFALPKNNCRQMCDIASWLDILTLGTEVAVVKGRDIIPQQSLAMSEALASEAFNIADLNYADAIAYLRRDNITVEGPKGIVLLTYDGHPLGFVKNLGNRANNLYPAQWRILSSNVPDKPIEVI